MSESDSDAAAGNDTAIWWKRGVIYQIYPRSFQDSNGDGIGDLEGIRRRLPYLTWLGVDAIWISPIFTSPMADFGYDVADYRDIDPLFGALDDFDRLAAAAHEAGLKLILDFVPNHTSDQHAWFKESRQSKQSPKRDWYIWRDPAPGGGPPNNWVSNFGGPAWTFDEATGQYYYHAFLKEQPDLNWRNPEVRAAMHDVLRFWLDRGVDGFRVDVIYHLMKDPEMRDNPADPAYREGRPEIERLHQIHSMDHPDVHDVVAGLRSVLDEYDDRLMIGEIYLPIDRLVAYYGRDLDGAHLPFNFKLIETEWDAEEIGRVIRDYEAALPPGGWPNWVLGNHDRARIASRASAEQARVAAMLLLTLRGTPTMYYGDELGMENVPIPAEAIQDTWAKREPGLSFGRDQVRTPMQWDASPGAGFSIGEPWLPLDANWRSQNVESQAGDPHSILSLYRRLLDLRRERFALSVGNYQELPAPADVLVYQRKHGDETLAVALNLGRQARMVELPSGRVLVSCSGDFDGRLIGGAISLPPGEGVIVDLAGTASFA